MRGLLLFLAVFLSVGVALAEKPYRYDDGKFVEAKHTYGEWAIWTDEQKEDYLVKSATATASDFEKVNSEPKIVVK